jgi:hypothetical protein
LSGVAGGAAGGASGTGGSPAGSGAWRPPRDSARRAVAVAVAGSLLLHTVAALWTWHAWRGFGRGGVLAWMDFPSSLFFLRLRGGAKLAWSLILGGLQWAAIGGGLSLAVGRSALSTAPGQGGKAPGETPAE